MHAEINRVFNFANIQNRNALLSLIFEISNCNQVKNQLCSTTFLKVKEAPISLAINHLYLTLCRRTL